MVMLHELQAVFDIYKPSAVVLGPQGQQPVHVCRLCGAAVLDTDGPEAIDPDGPIMRHVEFHRRIGDIG